MASEFDYRWAKDLVLWEMEQDGVLHRVKRLAMSAVCGSATNRALGSGLVRDEAAADGFAAAASVFGRLAVAPDGWSARAARPGEWFEAARRARAKTRQKREAGRARPT